MEFIDEMEIYAIPEDLQLNYIQQCEPNKNSLIVLLVKDELSTENKTLLEKICAATGVDFQTDVSIIGLNKDDDVSIHQILGLHPKIHFLIFGVEDDIMRTQFHKVKYRWIRFKDNSLLFSDGLAAFKDNQKLKQILWIALKQEFKN